MPYFIVPPTAKSWVPVAPDSDFSLQNLPFGVAELADGRHALVTRIGDQVLNLRQASDLWLLAGNQYPSLTSLDGFNQEQLSLLRKECFHLLVDGALKSELTATALTPVEETRMLLPMKIGAFVDFYSGINHASNVGKMFRPDMAPLLPNYRHLPVGYNGRGSSVVISGTDIRRPKGQTKAADADGPEFGPTREMDFELEMGFFVGTGNALGSSIPIGEAENHILGVVLVNDWSARDVQRWEYQPLGPFLAKSFGTSISPWVVTLDALEPFRREGQVQDPPVLPHLRPEKASHYDVQLEVLLQTEKMSKPQTLSTTNALELYWSFVQQLTHQASNGTNTEPGDLYASGTISGAEEGTYGSLLELTVRGSKRIEMVETGETRAFLEDGDVLTLRGHCQGDGFRVGFGEVTGRVVAAN